MRLLRGRHDQIVHGHAGRIAASLLAVLAVCAALPALARADDDDEDDDERPADVRVVGRCSGRSTLALRVRERDDDDLGLDLRLSTPRRGERWTIVVVRERRLVVRVSARSDRNGRVRLRRTFDDWFGDDAVVLRATGARGERCRASARIPDD